MPLGFYSQLPEEKASQTGKGVLRKGWPWDFLSILRIIDI
jgi:hypothetical protein